MIGARGRARLPRTTSDAVAPMFGTRKVIAFQLTAGDGQADEENIMIHDNHMRTLVQLGDSDLTLTHTAEDVRGRKVVDAHGQELGQVDDLLIDERERKVRFLRVSSGGFLGLGATKFLIPVEAIARVRADAVHIDQTADRVTAGPAYEPDLVDDQFVESLYDHYGYSPYWAEGYTYPPYPFYL